MRSSPSASTASGPSTCAQRCAISRGRAASTVTATTRWSPRRPSWRRHGPPQRHDGGRERLVDRHDRAADVLGMQVHRADVGQLLLPHGAHAESTNARAVAVEVVRLQDEHVAALAAPVQVPTRRRTLLERRDQLDELLAEGVHRVVDAELRDARISIRRVERQQFGELPRRRGEVADDEDDLADAQHGSALRSRETSARAFP
jgi:hypothetical protein